MPTDSEQLTTIISRQIEDRERAALERVKVLESIVEAASEKYAQIAFAQVAKCFEDGGRFGYTHEKDPAYKINQAADRLATLEAAVKAYGTAWDQCKDSTDESHYVQFVDAKNALLALSAGMR